MITITINEEKPDGSKSIWTLKVKSDMDAPTLIGILSKIMALNEQAIEIEPLRIKT